jgi:nucleotide-binding universal stress UspA family protein
MVERVLVPVDDSEHARGAVEFVRREFPEAAVVLLHVINPTDAGYSAGASFPFTSEDWFEQQEEAAEALLDDLEGLATPDGGEVERVVEVGRPTRTIVEYVEDHDVDHVVMGSHGRSGVTRVLLGSVAENVVRRSPVAVTVTR